VISFQQKTKRLEMLQISSERIGSRSCSRHITIIDPKKIHGDFSMQEMMLCFAIPKSVVPFASKRCDIGAQRPAKAPTLPYSPIVLDRKQADFVILDPSGSQRDMVSWKGTRVSFLNDQR
jgi:hypothetical protein